MKVNLFGRSVILTVIVMMMASLVIQLPRTAAQKGSKEKQVIELKKMTVTTRGAEKDPNIKDDTQLNDPAVKIDPPPSKGGVKTRGNLCEVRLDNWTKLIIKIYIDGKYRGTIGPFDDAVGYAIPGETSVYGRADYTDGTFSYWGPKTYNCSSGQYIYFKMTD